MPTTPSFSSLLDIHRALEAVFSLHQELLIVLEPELSTRIFDEYVSLLELHMRHEEQWLLPQYASHGVLPRFPVVLYEGQHRKMLALLRAVRTRLVALAVDKFASLTGTIQILDLEATYKHLAEHHDGAEAQGLFKGLDAALDSETRSAIVARSTSEFVALLEARHLLLEEGRALVRDRSGARVS